MKLLTSKKNHTELSKVTSPAKHSGARKNIFTAATQGPENLLEVPVNPWSERKLRQLHPIVLLPHTCMLAFRRHLHVQCIWSTSRLNLYIQSSGYVHIHMSLHMQSLWLIWGHLRIYTYIYIYIYIQWLNRIVAFMNYFNFIFVCTGSNTHVTAILLIWTICPVSWSMV